MPNKTAFHLLNEKVTVLKAIRDISSSKTSFKSANSSKSIQAMTAACGFPKEYTKNQDGLEKIQGLLDIVDRQKALYENSVKALSLYKGAVITHHKLLKSGNTTKEIEELSLANLKLYESELIKNGISKDVIESALIYQDFDLRLQDYYGKVLHDTLTDAVNTIGGTYNPAQVTTEMTFIDSTGGNKHLSQKMDQSLDYDDRDVYTTFADTGVHYFENFKEEPEVYNNNQPNDYKCFHLVNGEYVPKPYPDGFFAKIGYFFTKLANAGSEKREIEQDKANAVRALGDIPDEVKNDKALFELEELEPLGSEIDNLYVNLERSTDLENKFIQKFEPINQEEIISDKNQPQESYLDQLD